jgi:uncharacterized protein (TIGR03382 family)
LKRAIFLLLLATPARAAIEHDLDSDGDNRNNDEIAFATTVGPGADRYALLSVTSTGTAARVSAARLGATALGFIGAAEAVGGGCRTEWWGLVDPPPGAQPVVVSLAAPTPFAGATMITYRGVDQRRPLGAVTTASGALPPSTVALPAQPGALVLDNVCGWGPASVIADAGGGQTARWHWGTGSLSSAGSEKAGDASVALNWTAGGDGMMAWGAAGVVLNPSGQPRPSTDVTISTSGCATVGPGDDAAILLAFFALWPLRRRREHFAGRRVERT